MKRLVVVLFCAHLWPTHALANYELIFDDRNGLFEIRHHTREIVRTKFQFWGENWSWAGTKVSAGSIADLSYVLNGGVEKLGLTLDGTARNQRSPGDDLDIRALSGGGQIECYWRRYIVSV